MSGQNTRPVRVLLVDDDEDDYVVTRDLLTDIPGQRYDLDWREDFESGLAAITQQAHDVYLLDFRLGKHTGIELLQAAQQNGCIAPLIMLTGQGDKAIDEASMVAGAADYLVKDKLDAQQLERSIRYSLQQAKTLEVLREERASLAERVAERTRELSIANIELAKAAKAKDDFLASMSHELRTPLTGILAMAEVLAGELYGSLNEKQKRYVAILEESGHHLLSLINDILDIAKIDANKLELHYSRVSPRNVCEAALRLIKQNARKKNINLELEIYSHLSSIECDERRLKQMLMNLLSNAVKFTPEHGDIGLKVEQDASGETLLFTVWDTGIGIPQDRLNQLFQPFSQLDSGLARNYQGTGLGLNLVSRMVKLHGGNVSVQSIEGQGSRFSICLPVVAPGRPMIPEAGDHSEIVRPFVSTSVMPTPLAEYSKPLVLLAEDNQFNVMIYSELLENQGFRVNIANDGLQALEQVMKEQPDIILMDIQMPHMDGIEAIQRLRSNASTRQLPIIALTALAMEGDRERCLAAGATAYLSKPVSIALLLQTIRDLIAGATHGK